MGPIRSMPELIERAVALGPCRLVVPGAESESALSAAVEARRAGLAHPLLIGDRPAIEAGLRRLGDPAAHVIHHEPDAARAARRGARWRSCAPARPR